MLHALRVLLPLTPALSPRAGRGSLTIDNGAQGA
jgi:hypothetical protein